MSGMKKLFPVMMMAALMGAEFGGGKGGKGMGDEIKRGEQFERTCPVCGTVFLTTNRYQKFCNEKCRDVFGSNVNSLAKPPHKKHKSKQIKARLRDESY